MTVEWALHALFLLWVFGGSLLLSFLALFVAWISGRLPRLRDFDAAPPSVYPKLSILVPACNEASTVEAALGTLLAADYPNLEIVVIDDRSTDETGHILERIASADSRVKVVRIRELPDGWLGKVHALHLGIGGATGEWLLFTDADVHYAKDTLRHTIRLALANQLDLLSIGPSFRADTVALRSMILAFGETFLLTLRPDRVAHGSTQHFVGIGAFNLVRRSLFDKTGGFGALRMEVADDVGLALLLHEAGAKIGFYSGAERLEIEWYASVRDMLRGLEKNLFGVSMRWSFTRFFAQLPLLIGLLSAPLGAVFLGSTSAVIVGAFCLCVSICASVVTSVRMGLGSMAGIFVPFGYVLVITALLRSAFVTMFRRGISWRGTFYPINALRAGQRLRL